MPVSALPQSCYKDRQVELRLDSDKILLRRSIHLDRLDLRRKRNQPQAVFRRRIDDLRNRAPFRVVAQVGEIVIQILRSQSSPGGSGKIVRRAFTLTRWPVVNESS